MVIEVRELTKCYGAHLAVDDVGFTVTEGEIFGILGVNGAGKTITVECLQGLRRPDRGRMRVFGLDPRTAGSQLRALVGSQLQASALPDRWATTNWGQGLGMLLFFPSSASAAPAHPPTPWETR